MAQCHEVIDSWDWIFLLLITGIATFGCINFLRPQFSCMQDRDYNSTYPNNSWNHWKQFLQSTCICSLIYSFIWYSISYLKTIIMAYLINVLLVNDILFKPLFPVYFFWKNYGLSVSLQKSKPICQSVLKFTWDNACLTLRVAHVHSKWSKIARHIYSSLHAIILLIQFVI